jgi:hypothetical protein
MGDVKRDALPENDEPPKVYGVDVTDDLETLAEGTLNDDGTISMEFVTLDKRVECPFCGSKDCNGVDCAI